MAVFKGDIVSIPPFDPRFHIQNLYATIMNYSYRYKKTLSQSHETLIQKTIHSTVMQWDKEILERNYQDLTGLKETTKKILKVFAEQIFVDKEQTQAAAHNEAQEVINQLDDQVDALSLVLELNSLIAQIGNDINAIIENHRGRVLFKKMVELGDPWAMAHILKMSQSIKENDQLIIYEILNEAKSIAIVYKNIIEANGVVQLAVDLCPSAIVLMFHIIKSLDCSNGEHKNILDKIIKIAADQSSPREQMQSLLLVYVSELGVESAVSQYIISQIEGFKLKNGGLPINTDRLLDRLISFPGRIELKKKSYFDPGGEQHELDVSWSDYSLILRLCSKFMEIEKDRKFFNFVAHSLQLENPAFLPSSKYFTKADGLLIGQVANCEYFVNAVAKELTDPFQIAIYSPTCRHAQTDNLDANVIAIEGDEEATLWLQDPCLMTFNKDTNQARVLFPRATLPREIQALNYLNLRTERVKKAINDPDFNPPEIPLLGRITASGEQLKLLDSLVQNIKSMDSLQTTMTFFEGGNILVGKDSKNLPYVIIGADLIEMNRQLLANDMQALGINKSINGNWIVNPTRSSARVELSDQEIKAFIAEDLGLASINQVHIVEQPGTFHLDMGMFIGDKETIFINNAIEAHQVLEQNMRESMEAFDDLTNTQLNQIWEEAEKLVKYENIAENQLKQQGFRVVRMAGRFRSLALEERMGRRFDSVNFFNFVSLTLRQKGEKEYNQPVVIALGCIGFYQEKFKKMISSGFEIDIKSVNFIFLDEKYSEAALKGRGGIKCMTKVFENI